MKRERSSGLGRFLRRFRRDEGGTASVEFVLMVPVFLTLAGSGVDTEGKLFMGWFGPRGLASIVFAVIVTTVCCYQGYFAHMRTDSYGARAIGRSTTAAVVISCVLILIADYIVTSLLI